MKSSGNLHGPLVGGKAPRGLGKLVSHSTAVLQGVQLKGGLRSQDCQHVPEGTM